MLSISSHVFRTNQWVKVILTGAAVLILAACQPAAATTQPGAATQPGAVSNPTPAETAQVPVTGETQATGGLTPSVTVNDQSIASGEVTIDRVVSDGPGWIVIHTQKDGAPGPVIGHAAVMSGENTNVVVTIDASQATPTLYAMLHVDTGTVDVYEFPGADVPAMANGEMVNPSFTAEGVVGSASTGEATGAMDEYGYGTGTSQAPGSTTPVSGEGTIAVATHPTLGDYLVDDQGMTLYIFERDTPNTSNCSEQCLETWPPFQTSGTVSGSSDITGTLGVITRDDGSQQATINEMPLYYFEPDNVPGDILGQGVGEVWYLVAPDGTVIK